MKKYLPIIAVLFLLGCNSENAPNSQAHFSEGSSVATPIPSIPAEPSLPTDDDSGSETVENQGRIISSADGSTPPPPPTITR